MSRSTIAKMLACIVAFAAVGAYADEWKAKSDVDWDVDKNVVRVLDVVKDDPHITQQEIAVRLNLSLRGVEDMIKRAREKGFIRRVGGKRFGHWEVVK